MNHWIKRNEARQAAKRLRHIEDSYDLPTTETEWQELYDLAHEDFMIVEQWADYCRNTQRAK